MQEIAAQISMKGAEGRWWDFRSIFSTRGHRYRFWLGVMNLIWSQFAGNGLITCEYCDTFTKLSRLVSQTGFHKSLTMPE